MDFTSIPQPAVSETPISVAASLAFTEGPAAAEDGSVYFSDIVNDRIMRYSPDGRCTVFRQPCGRTIGQTFGPDGVLWHCEGSLFGPGGGRRISRTNLQTGEYEVVTEEYDGVRYNAPNDICSDSLGRMYFTDPCYGDRTEMEMDIEGVYRIDTDGSVTRIIQQPDIERPNGIAVSQDNRLLYLIDSCPTVGGNRKAWRFDLDEAGNPSNQQVVFDFAPGRGGDGMRLDVEGNLYVASGIITPRGVHETTDVPPGIHLISPQGDMLGRIPIPEDVLTNLAFGGLDGRTLFITAGKTLFTTRVTIPGQVAYPRWNA